MKNDAVFWDKNFSKDEAKKILKIKIIRLNAFAANKRALAFYKKMGIKRLGRIRGGLKYYGRFMDEIILVKYL